MDAEKLGSSETSSEETDQQEEVQEESSGGVKRSYECTFCRRGFTNAQALGGHMNIHRKDRAKAKQITSNSSLPRKFSNDETLSSPYVSEFPCQPSRYYSIIEAQRNYNTYFQPPPPPNPRQPPSYAFGYEFLNQRGQSFNMNQELLDANLSLRVGPNHDESDQVRRGIPKDDEVDLELRLGHDPY